MTENLVFQVTDELYDIAVADSKQYHQEITRAYLQRLFPEAISVKIHIVQSEDVTDLGREAAFLIFSTEAERKTAQEKHPFPETHQLPLISDLNDSAGAQRFGLIIPFINSNIMQMIVNDYIARLENKERVRNNFYI